MAAERPPEGLASSSRMIIAAHQDDDILFMHRDLRDQIDASAPITTVFVTSGDAGQPEAYWRGREDGVRAAYATMAGVAEWVDGTASFTLNDRHFEIATSYLAERPEIRLYFLRVPDGPGGNGTPAYGRQSLQKLWTGDIETVTTADGQNIYSRADLTAMLTALMDAHRPETIMTQDAWSRHATAEHSDHRHTARFTMLAHQDYNEDHEFTAYVGYSSRRLAQNVTGEEYDRAYRVFRDYAVNDPHTISGYDQNGEPIFFANYPLYLGRQYTIDAFGSYWLNNMGQLAGNWRVATHERQVADVDGDGRADLVGFADTAVRTGLSNGLGFNELRDWSSGFAGAQGWSQERHERMLADVNGDGLMDVVAFGNEGAWVALSDGRRFGEASLWIVDFGYESGAGGWRNPRNERETGDVNGDGLDDVIGFGSGGIRVSLSTGQGFADSAVWTNEALFRARNIDPTRHVRETADVNGDGLDDVVLFSDSGAMVALSNGAGFDRASLWIADFGYAAGNWRTDRHERVLADVDGDGLDDIVGFGNRGVLVALSNGDGFDLATLWTTEDDFRVRNWDPAIHERRVGDVNGDGLADIIWFDDHGVRVSLSTGSSFHTPDYDQFQFI